MVVEARRRVAIVIISLGMWFFLLAGRMAWSGSPHAFATLRLIAVVSPKVKLELLRQTSQIGATREDLDRGYVEIPNAAELVVSTNIKSGLAIIARVGGNLQGSKGDSIPVSALSFSVNGEGFRPFAASEQVIYVGRGQEIRSLKRLDYRLNLDGKAEPDSYFVNITFTVMAN